MTFHVSITTYNRPAQCLETIQAVHKEFEGLEYTLSVIDDGSTCDYKAVEVICAMHGHTYHRNALNNGKRKHWINTNHVFHYFRLSDADYLVWLADDMKYKDGWLNAGMETLKAGGFGIVNLFLDHRAYSTSWHRTPKKHQDGYFYDGIFDCCGILSKKSVSRLEWFVPFMHPKRWERKPNLSSGVGKWITVNTDLPIGIVGEQWLTHDWSRDKSKMNNDDLSRHRK